MADVTQGLRTLGASHQQMSSTDDSSWIEAPCPHCANPRLVKVAGEVDNIGSPVAGATEWLRCPVCRGGCVRIRGSLHPAAMPLREPRGLPETDGRIWAEARTCLGVGANAAAVMLCRKLLFHIAVAHGLPPKNGRNRAPSFTDAVKHLETEGVVTKRMTPWVARIKDVGNDANHELTPITSEEALDVATFTEQLLRLAYELDALMEDPSVAESPDSTMTL